MLKQKTVRQKSLDQEKRIAKQVKGSVVKGSGCLWYKKGDIEMDKFLIEAKTTDADSYALTTKTINKIIDEGLTKGKEAILQIDFRLKQLQVAVVPWMNFQLMLEDTQLAMSQGERVEMLETVIKVLVHRMFEKEMVEHTDEIWEYLSGQLAKIAKDPSAAPKLDVRI